MSVTAEDSTDRHYLPHLDSMRGLAVLGVVIAHFDPAPLVVSRDSSLGRLMAAAQTFALGNVAVVFFFTLSAFLLTYLCSREYDTTGKVSIARFMVRRVLRIWPLYFTVVGVSYALYSRPELPAEFAGSAATWQWLSKYSWIYLGFLSNWSLTFNYVGSHVDPSPGALRILWSIGVEEQFYLVYPFALLAVLRRPHVRYWIVGFIVLCAWGFRSWFGTIDVTNQSLRSAGGMYYATFSYLDVLLAGAFAGWLAAHRSSHRAWAWLAHPGTGPLLLVAIAATAAIWSSHLWYPYDLVSRAIYLVMGGLFALFLLWSCAGRQPFWMRPLMWPPLRKLGAISYGIYMWHVLSNACLATALKLLDTGSFFFSSPEVRFAGSIATAIAFASVSWVVIERPFLRLKARFRPRFT